MQHNPIQRLPQQFQAMAQGLVENVLSVVRLFADVDPGSAADEEAAARLYVEEVMVDVAQAMAHGRESAIPKILARVDARRARIRIRAKGEGRKAMKSAILVGAGALADVLTHGLGSPLAKGIMALQAIAAPVIDDQDEVEEFAELHHEPVVEPEPTDPGGSGDDSSTDTGDGKRPGADGSPGLEVATGAAGSPDPGGTGHDTGADTGIDKGTDNSSDTPAGIGGETTTDDPENADSAAAETGTEDDKGGDTEGDNDEPEPTVGASTDEGPEGSEPGAPADEAAGEPADPTQTPSAGGATE